MGYPTTDWPGSVDSVLTRADGIDTVFDDDFNYPDDQIRTVQAWLGLTGELLGAGIAGEGPGGMVSPVASGGTAFQLAARSTYGAGSLLSVGDNYDVSYVEKFAIAFNGVVGLNALASLPAAGTPGRLVVKSGAAAGLYLDDGTTWRGLGPVLTGTADPNGSITGFFGQLFRDTVGTQWYACDSDPTGTVWTAV